MPTGNGRITPLTEPVPIFDVYTDGIARVDVLGGTVRITYFSFHCVAGRIGMTRVVCSKMIWPFETLVRHGGRLSRFIAAGKSGEWSPIDASIRGPTAMH